MGVLSPNNQYNIYWTKYDRLSQDLFLSSSYPKTQPLALYSKCALNQMSSTTRFLSIGRSNFPFMQPLLGPLFEWWRAGVEIPQHQEVHILEFAEMKNVAVGEG